MEGKRKGGEIAGKIPEMGVGSGQTYSGIHGKEGDAEGIVKGSSEGKGIELREETDGGGDIGKGMLGGSEEKRGKWEGDGKRREGTFGSIGDGGWKRWKKMRNEGELKGEVLVERERKLQRKERWRRIVEARSNVWYGRVYQSI